VNVCIIIAAKQDIHADAVVDRLEKRALVIRFDPFDVLPTLKFCSGSDEVKIGSHQFHIEEISGVFCRVALEALNFDMVHDPVEKFAAREHLNSLIGILLNIQKEKWINFPWSEAVADGKLSPMNLARRLGISVPEFLVSSFYQDLLAFNLRHGPCIVKPLSDMSIAKQDGRFVEVPDMADFSAPYTADFLPDNVPIKDADELTPTLIQRKIEKTGDVRAVLLDDKIFCSFLHNCSNLVDSRLTQERHEEVFELDSGILEKLRNLMSRLSLRFAALDLIVGVDRNLYLVDLNPSGNWLWQEQSLGLPISYAISESLLVGK
jgi:hypothetical protein